ncbi:MAG: DUF2130 domain-containing protein [Chitinophagaceae bacterium]|nr:DUF2130 domain-containing protein [Chitinophagaceae bacterium]
MATEIKCPNCGHSFEPNDAIRDEVQRELRSQAADWQKKKTEEFQSKLEEEKKRMQQQMEDSIRKNISADYENKLLMLEKNNTENEAKLKEARQQQLDIMKKEQELKNKEEELELSVQKKLNEARETLSKEIRKLEEERNQAKETEFQLRLKEMEEKLEAQKKLAEEMKRRAEQGSMQLQGEAQELALEEMLRTTFPFDLVTEVGKGVRGADCIQTVRNNLAQECGKIIYESKRTREFSSEWIEKLKADMRSQGADVALLVTQTFPKDMKQFGEKDGIWICSFAEVKAVVMLIRDGIIKISQANKSQENRGDKMHMLYDYLTSREFSEQWKAIGEGFMGMKISILKEREQMEKLWKAREKQLEKIMLNAVQVQGSILGIAGKEIELLLPGSQARYKWSKRL